MSRTKVEGSGRKNIVLHPDAIKNMEFIQHRLHCSSNAEAIRRMGEIVADVLRLHDEGVKLQCVYSDGLIETLRFLGLPPKP